MTVLSKAFLAVDTVPDQLVVRNDSTTVHKHHTLSGPHPVYSNTLDLPSSKQAEDRDTSHTVIINTNCTSESYPNGEYLCQHVTDHHSIAYNTDLLPEDASIDHLRLHTSESNAKKLELIGIPDSALHELHLENTSEFVWKRMAVAHSENEKRHTFKLPNLSSLELHSPVGCKENMPFFYCSSTLEKLELVALPGSTHSWNISELITTSDLRYGLKQISVTGYKSLRYIIVGKVGEKAESLSFVDCIPEFLPDSGSMKPFDKLTKLSLDAGLIISLRSTPGSRARWNLLLSDKSFPCLEVLELHSSEDRASYKASVIEIDVPSTCALVGLSTWIEYQLLELRQSGKSPIYDQLCGSTAVSRFKFNEFDERVQVGKKREQIQWYHQQERGIFKRREGERSTLD